MNPNLITVDPEKVKIDKGTGYCYFTQKGHPLATGSSHRVYLHRHIASVAIGRWVTTDEDVHHIDEVKTNNLPENLSILTRAEHGKLAHKMRPRNPIIITTCICGNKTRNKRFCSYRCSAAGRRRFERPSKETLSKQLETIPAQRIAKKMGISIAGLYKVIKTYGLITKPRGYWRKQLSKRVCNGPVF